MLNFCGKSRIILASVFAAIFFFCAVSQAKNINWDELEKKAQQYTGDSTINVTNRSSGNRSSNSESVNLDLGGQPTSRIVDTTVRMLSEKDIRHVTVHMKLANRYFLRKNYERAVSELELVFDRQPDHAGGRYMRAVIAARLKQHLVAWQNILIAQEKDPSLEKLDVFIDKLSSVMPKPQKFIGVPGIYRPVPKSACEKATDVMENFLKQPASAYLVNFSTEDYVAEGSDASMVIDMNFSAGTDGATIEKIFADATGEPVERLDDKSDAKHIKLKFKIFDLPIKNPKVKAVSSLIDFVKIIAEEADVAISDTVERDKENKILETNYQIAAREFGNFNDFLRKASPYAHYFRVLNMRLSYIPNTQDIIWKGKIMVEYQLQ
jgi:hypothetical protein